MYNVVVKDATEFKDEKQELPRYFLCVRSYGGRDGTSARSATAAAAAASSKLMPRPKGDLSAAQHNDSATSVA